MPSGTATSSAASAASRIATSRSAAPPRRRNRRISTTTASRVSARFLGRRRKLRDDMRGGALHRRNRKLAQGMHVGLADLDAKRQCLGLSLRHMQRAEQPVPDREAASEVLVEVQRIVRMMDLVMRRAQEYAARHAGERNPQMRVLEVHI